MLSAQHIPRTQIVILHKWTGIAYNMVRLSSNSSSSDSSDSSDSDSDLNIEPQQKPMKMTSINSGAEEKDIDLYELINQYEQNSPTTQVNIKINEKDKNKKLENRIRKTADMLTSFVGGDKEKVVSSLLSSISAVKNKTKSTKPISEDATEFKYTNRNGTLNMNMKSKPVITSILEEVKKQKELNKISLIKELNKQRYHENSVINKLLSNEKASQSQEASKTSEKKSSETQSISENLRQNLRIEKQKELNEISLIKELNKQRYHENSVINKLLLNKKASQSQEASKTSEKKSSETQSISENLRQNLRIEKQKELNEISLIKELNKQRYHENSVINKLLANKKASQSQEASKTSETQSIRKNLRRNLRTEEHEFHKSLKDNKKTNKGEDETDTLLKIQNIDQCSIANELLYSRLKNTQILKKNKYVKRETNMLPLNWILSNDDVEKLEKRDQENMSRYPSIFTKIDISPAKNIELDTWNLCEKKYMKMIINKFPENAFQEMAQWTEEGKMWNFPIDNEQGMDEEHSVHFSEHVFMEQHLTGWCPTKGPIRHFMELVCTGLSKNPYMTVQEKYDTIMWYRDFFADKSDLLKKLGLSEIAQSAEKQAKLVQ